ncbi:MAG TPA: glycoside hydrolase domain-containing protein [Terriglobia bacterium]|nr:glycoside hydrolase domain-containing protein [Terriglobia bacterium]
MTRQNNLALLALMVITCCFRLPVAKAQSPGDALQAWAVSTGMRLTPASIDLGGETAASAEAFRNEIVSLQFAVRSSESLEPFRAWCQTSGDAGTPLPCSWVRIRYPGYVPVVERGEYIADALLPSPPPEIKPNWTQGVWLTISVPKNADPAVYRAALQVQAGSTSKRFEISVHVLDFTLPDLTQGSFYLNIWQDPAAVARVYHAPLWSPAHWRLLEAYTRNLADHGERSITTSIVYDPWQSQTGFVFPSMVEWRFPGTYQQGQASKFQFDFSVFDRYVEMMMRAGIDKSIQCFSMVDGPGSTSLCNIGYIDTSTGKLRICPTRVGNASYRDVWGAFLPVFVRHLRQHGWLARTYIGFDEKPQSVMNGIFSVLKAAAPGLKVALAGGTSSQQSGTVGDLTIFSSDLSHPAAVQHLVEERRTVGPTTFYTCCSPALPNTFIYSPQWESRLLPWIAFRYDLDGYLRWAYESWPDDVWKHPESRWHSGDTFFVYPGKDGPIDSTRWEMLRQGVEDYEALHLLKKKIAELQRNPERSNETQSLARRMRTAVLGATDLNTCQGVPSPGLSRRQIDALLAETEGTQTMSYTSDSRIISKRAPEDFAPDGNLQKEIWQTADWAHFDNDMSGQKDYPQSETDVATVWTPHYVYFADRCKYTTLNVFEHADPVAERWGLWNRDVVEVFINPQPERVNHYYEFEVSPNNLWIDLEINKDQSPFNDASWDSHFDHATRIDPEHHIWTCEMRIPVDSMGAKLIAAGAEWRLNLFRADGPGDDSQRRFLSWSTIPSGNSFHVPTRFGIIQFAK